MHVHGFTTNTWGSFRSGPSSKGGWCYPTFEQLEPELYMEELDKKKKIYIYIYFKAVPPLIKGLSEQAPSYLKIWICHC